MTEEFTNTKIGYFGASRTPWFSLLFILPFLLCYEIGRAITPDIAARGGVDEWLRSVPFYIGLGYSYLLPLLTIGLLLGWHYTLRKSWKIRSWHYLLWMLGEVIVYSFLLWSSWQILESVLQNAVKNLQAPPGSIGETTVSIIQTFGTGIYEELLFRLLLLSGIYLTLRRWTNMKEISIVVIAILGSAFLFSLAHYIPNGFSNFNLVEALFLFFLGVCCAVIFRIRGFGIVAGTHIAYNIFALFSR